MSATEMELRLRKSERDRAMTELKLVHELLDDLRRIVAMDAPDGHKLVWIKDKLSL